MRSNQERRSACGAGRDARRAAAALVLGCLGALGCASTPVPLAREARLRGTGRAEARSAEHDQGEHPQTTDEESPFAHFGPVELGQIGAAEMRLGKYQAAAEHLTLGLSKLPPTGKEKERTKLEELLAEAKKEVGTLKLTVTPPEALVNVAGERIEPEKLKGEIFVEPGEMRVEAGGLPTHRPVTQSVKVAKGQVVEVSLVLAPIPTVPTASATATATATSVPVSPGPNKAIVIGGAVAAGAAFIVGGVLLGVAEGTRSQLQAEAPKKADGTAACSNGEPPTGANEICNDLRARAAMGSALGQGGIVLLVAGGALAAGTALYGLWPRPKQSPAARLVPIVGPNTAGMVLTGSF